MLITWYILQQIRFKKLNDILKAAMKVYSILNRLSIITQLWQDIIL